MKYIERVSIIKSGKQAVWQIELSHSARITLPSVWMIYAGISHLHGKVDFSQSYLDGDMKPAYLILGVFQSDIALLLERIGMYVR